MRSGGYPLALMFWNTEPRACRMALEGGRFGWDQDEIACLQLGLPADQVGDRGLDSFQISAHEKFGSWVRSCWRHCVRTPLLDDWCWILDARWSLRTTGGIVTLWEDEGKRRHLILDLRSHFLSSGMNRTMTFRRSGSERRVRQSLLLGLIFQEILDRVFI
jgi:hypothetical protein